MYKSHLLAYLHDGTRLGTNTVWVCFEKGKRGWDEWGLFIEGSHYPSPAQWQIEDTPIGDSRLSSKLTSQSPCYCLIVSIPQAEAHNQPSC